jgi:hypothetical protein
MCYEYANDHNQEDGHEKEWRRGEMTDENTKDLTDSEKLNLILAELADLRQWRAKVDAFIDDCSRDTRPKLDLIIKELSDAREEIRDVAPRLDRIESRLEGWRWTLWTFAPLNAAWGTE